MASRNQKYLMYAAVAAGGWAIYRTSKGLPIIPSFGTPAPLDTSTPLLPVTSIIPPSTIITSAGTPTGSGISTPYGPYYPSNFGPTIPAGTPQDVAVCLSKKSGNGWTIDMCSKRLTDLKAAYAAAKANAASAGAGAGAVDTSGAQAEIARYQEAIRTHSAALAQETDPGQRQRWQQAINEFNAAIVAIQGRLSALQAQNGGSGGSASQWSQAAAGHKADYYALTGITLN